VTGNPAFYNAFSYSNVDGVLVVTRNDAGTLTDESFYLAVLCAG
jgi:hypothetical protein